jgi:hypothetical protein
MAEQHGKLEDGLLQAMKAIDNQVARAMQRSPAQRDVHGVQKWEPYATRVEHITAFVLEELGGNTVTFDALLVLGQAFAKALTLAVSDLGREGLGTTRASYCLDAMERIERDALEVSRTLSEQRLV